MQDEDLMEQIRDDIMDMQDIPVQSKGHTLQSQSFSGFELGMTISDKKLMRIHKALQEGKLLPEPIKIKFPGSGPEVCSFCRSSEFLFDGVSFLAQSPCPYKDGIPMSVELNVPSGRILVGNDFREWFSIDQAIEDSVSVNYASGIKTIVDEYAKQSMLHFFVGNSCPSVTQVAKDSFLVGNHGYQEDKKSALPGQELGGVCTDLWWVSIVDGAEAEQRGLPESEVEVELHVSPGRYRLKYHALKKGFNRFATTEPVIFAELEKI